MNSKNTPLVIAHRGESDLAPENSIAACKLALEQGATALEVDVRLCGSGEVVLFHDNFLYHHFGSWKPMAGCSLKELQSLDYKGRDYQHPAKICTLSEFFEEFKGKIPLNLDAKTMFSNFSTLSKSLFKVIDDFSMQDQVWISSFNPVFLKILKYKRPEIRTGYLFRNLLPVHNYIDVFLKSDAWHPHHSVVDDHFFEMAQKVKKEVYVWTINEALILEKMSGYQYEGIITDTLFRKNPPILSL